VGTTRNGFAWIDEKIELAVEQCPKCGASEEKQKETINKKNQTAELYLARSGIEILAP